MIISFLGVMAISFSKPVPDNQVIAEESSSRLPGILFAFFIAWLTAGNYVLSRKLKDIPVSVILVFHSTFGLTMASIWLLAQSFISGNDIRVFSIETYVMLLLICVIDFVQLNCATIAF